MNSDHKIRAYVLGGGGSRGALQVGALRALIEAGILPDLIVGTSIGALNAAFLAIRGLNLQTIDILGQIWKDASRADLLPGNKMLLGFNTLFHRSEGVSFQRVRRFCLTHGLSPSIRFQEICGSQLYLVATDLKTGNILVYGDNPRDFVLEGVMASSAIPPWVRPIHTDGRYLMDGGMVSNLPIEPALCRGAGHIITLDLADSQQPNPEVTGLRPFFGQLLQTVQNRQLSLELNLAEARGATIWRLPLGDHEPLPIWDFSRTDELIDRGYTITKERLSSLIGE